MGDIAYMFVYVQMHGFVYVYTCTCVYQRTTLDVILPCFLRKGVFNWDLLLAN